MRHILALLLCLCPAAALHADDAPRIELHAIVPQGVMTYRLDATLVNETDADFCDLDGGNAMAQVLSLDEAGRISGLASDTFQSPEEYSLIRYPANSQTELSAMIYDDHFLGTDIGAQRFSIELTLFPCAQLHDPGETVFKGDVRGGSTPYPASLRAESLIVLRSPWSETLLP